MQLSGPKELKVGASMVGLTVEEATKKIKEEMGEGISVEVFQSLVVVWLVIL